MDTKLPTDPRIHLSDKEVQIFKLVLATCAHHGLKTTVRVAGGWVRDKLLGRISGDLDLAVDDCTGAEFAQKLVSYMQQTKLGEHSRVAVIKSNPDQSKHLETATFTVFGYPIDITNLRTEIYKPDSRIPEMKMGSVEEDCMRRDFTVNALYYNINTGQVEDYKGGLKDLASGLLRCPAPPSQTFRDDPLRVLRAVRFAARLNYRIDESVASAAQQPEVQQELATKVSRERYGIEIDKMVGESVRTVAAFRTICEWGLRPIVFASPPKMENDPERRLIPSLSDPLALLSEEEGKRRQAVDELCLSRMTAAESLCQNASEVYPSISFYQGNPLLRRALMYAAFLSPYHGIRYPTGKDKFASVLQFIIRDSIKLPMTTVDSSIRVCTAAHAVAMLLQQVDEQKSFTSSSEREETKLISSEEIQLASGRWLKIAKELWPAALDLGRVLLLESASSSSESARTTLLLQQWNAYRTFLLNQSDLLSADGKSGVWDWKPLLNGKEITTILELPPGPTLGILVDIVGEWRILHPRATKDECISYVESSVKLRAKELVAERQQKAAAAAAKK